MSEYMLDFPINKFKLALPGGAIEAQELSQLFSKLSLRAYKRTDYENFPVSYSCISTNMATGKPVRLHNGSLPESMRSSMAIPSIFTPVVIRDTLLVDGGLVRNFPVEEAIELGADIVIGVNVSGDSKSKEELDDLIAILLQSSLFMGEFDTEEQKKKCDIIIEPDLKGRGSADFGNSAEIIESGYESSKPYFTQLKALADSLNAIAPQKPLEIMPVFDSIRIDAIELKGLDKQYKKFIERKLGLSLGEKIAVKDIDEGVRLLYGSLNFERISYNITEVQDQNILEIHTKEKFSSRFRMAYHYDYENFGSLLLNFTSKDIKKSNLRTSLSVAMSSNPRFFGDVYRYFGKKHHWGTRLSAFYNSYDYTRLSSDKQSTESVYDLREAGSRLEFTQLLAINSMLSYGLNYTYSQIKPKVVATKQFESLRISSLEAAVTFNVNTLNRPFLSGIGIEI